MFCYSLLDVHSSFAIMSIEKRELVALLCLSSFCLIIVVWHFLIVSWVYLQFMIVVFSDHTHYFWLRECTLNCSARWDSTSVLKVCLVILISIVTHLVFYISSLTSVSLKRL